MMYSLIAMKRTLAASDRRQKNHEEKERERNNAFFEPLSLDPTDLFFFLLLHCKLC